LPGANWTFRGAKKIANYTIYMSIFSNCAGKIPGFASKVV